MTRLRITVSYRALPSAFWLLWSGTLINQLGMFVAPFFMIYLTQVRDFSVVHAAVSVSLVGVGTLIAAPVGGILADRWGRRPTLVGSLVSAACCTIMLGMARSVVLIDGLALLVGFTSNVFRPAAAAAIIDLVAEEHRRQAFALNYWAGNVGVAIGPMLAGFLMQWRPTAIFFIDGLTTLVFGVWMSRCVWPPTAAPTVKPGETSRRNLVRPLGRDRPLIALALLAFCFAVVYFQNTSTLPIVMHARGLTDADYGAVIAMNGATVLVFSVPIHAMIRRMRPARAMAGAALLLGTGFGLISIAHGELAMMMTVVIWTLGEVIATPVASTWIGQISPPHLRGTYQGIYSSGWGAAQMAGPLAGGLVLTMFGSQVLWGACFGLGIAVAGGYILLTRHAQHWPEERRPTVPGTPS